MLSKEEIRERLQHKLKMLQERRSSIRERLAKLREYQQQLATELHKVDWDIVETQKELEFLNSDWDDIQRAVESAGGDDA